MQEFDLKKLWDQTDERAEAWYQNLRPELAATARRKNDSVLQRIRRLVQSELIFSGLVVVALLWYRELIQTSLLGILISSILFVMLVTYQYYRQFSEEIAAVPTLNLVASTERYLHILSSYKKRLVRLSMLLMPFGLMIGFTAGFGIGTENDFSALGTSKFWLISIPALLLIAIPTYYITVWYYRFFIGSQERELAAVLERLKEEG